MRRGQLGGTVAANCHGLHSFLRQESNAAADFQDTFRIVPAEESSVNGRLVVLFLGLPGGGLLDFPPPAGSLAHCRAELQSKADETNPDEQGDRRHVGLSGDWKLGGDSRWSGGSHG